MEANKIFSKTSNMIFFHNALPGYMYIVRDHSLIMAGGGLVISIINQIENSSPPCYKSKSS